MTNCRLSPLAFGLSLGLVWGASVLIMGLIAFYFAFGTEFVTAMGVLYINYEATVIGSLIGGLYGFIDAFIGGLVIAWLYNIFAGCCGKSCK